MTQSNPGEPQSFIGSITQSNGLPIPSGTELFAFINDQREGSITVDPSGQYGAQGAFESKLTVNTGAGDEVVFRLFSETGPQAFESPFPLADAESEPEELDLTFENNLFGSVSGGTTSPGGEIDINIAADAVSELELDGLWVGWTIENVNISGNPQVTRPDGGRTAQLSFSQATDISGSLTLSLGDSSKYVSGEYVLTAIINSDGGTSSEELSLIIEPE